MSSSGGFTMCLIHVSTELKGMAKTCLRQFHFQLPSFAVFITIFSYMYMVKSN